MNGMLTMSVHCAQQQQFDLSGISLNDHKKIDVDVVAVGQRGCVWLMVPHKNADRHSRI